MSASLKNNPEYDKIYRDIQRRHYHLKPGAKLLLIMLIAGLFLTGIVAVRHKNIHEAIVPPCQLIKSNG